MEKLAFTFVSVMKRLVFARVIFNYNSTIRSLVSSEDFMKLHNIANRLADLNTTMRLLRGKTKRCFLGKSYSIGFLQSKNLYSRNFVYRLICIRVKYREILNSGLTFS